MWHWFSRGVGGKSALDYLVIVEGYPFLQAVEHLLDCSNYTPITQPSALPLPTPKRPFQLPILSQGTERVETYLQERGIHPVILRHCIEQRNLAQTFLYHNALFLGRDTKGAVRYGALRGILGDYKGEVIGSDKRFSFAFGDCTCGQNLHLYESAIDALSHATMRHLKGQLWQSDAYLSLAGVYIGKEGAPLPAALTQFLSDHPHIKTLHLHLDNDEVGRGATAHIMRTLEGQLDVKNEPSKVGKDMNEMLIGSIGQRRPNRGRER